MGQPCAPHHQQAQNQGHNADNGAEIRLEIDDSTDHQKQHQIGKQPFKLLDPPGILSNGAGQKDDEGHFHDF